MEGKSEESMRVVSKMGDPADESCTWWRLVATALPPLPTIVRGTFTQSAAVGESEECIDQDGMLEETVDKSHTKIQHPYHSCMIALSTAEGVRPALMGTKKSCDL